MSRRNRLRRQEESPAPSQEILPRTSGTQTADFWQKAIILCFHVLLFTVPLFFTWVNEELFEFNKIIIAYAVVVIIATCWIARMISKQKIIFRRTPFDWYILAFFISQCISTLLSMDPHTSFFGYYTRFHGGLLSTIAYITLFYAFVSNVEKKQIRPLFLTTFFSALLVSLMAIPEHFGHSFSCLLINTGHAPDFWAALAPQEIWKNYNVSCWIQQVQDRVFASFGQPNWLAAYAIILIPVGIFLGSETTVSKRKSAFYFVTTLLLFLSLLFTKSRSGLLGLGLGLGFFAVLCLTTIATRWKTQSDQRKTFAMFLGFCIAVAGVFLAAAIYFGTPYTPSLAEIVHKTAPTASSESEAPVQNRLDIGGTDSGEIRRIVWTGAIKVWERYPIFGSGVETFAYSYYRDRPAEHNLVSEWDFLYNKAHNEFLNFLATTGIVGLSTYVAMLGAFIILPLVQAFKKKVAPFEKISFLPFAYSAGIVALSVSNFFGFSTVMVTILLFLYPAFFIVEEIPFFAPETSLPSDEPSSTNQKMGYGVVFIAAGMLLVFICIMWLSDYYYATGKYLVQSGNASGGIENLQRAVTLAPNEAYFYDELATVYAESAIALAKSGDATSAATLATASYREANQMLALQPVNLNLYKTKTRVLLALSQLQPNLLYEAKDTLVQSTLLAPTDAKLFFNLGIVEISLGQQAEGIRTLQHAVDLKADYGVARHSLAQQYASVGRFDEAKQQYEYILKNIDPGNKQIEEELQAVQSGKFDLSKYTTLVPPPPASTSASTSAK